MNAESGLLTVVGGRLTGRNITWRRAVELVSQ